MVAKLMGQLPPNVEINEKYINLLIENCVTRNTTKLCHKVEIINMRKCPECVPFFTTILLIISHFIPSPH